MITFILLKDKLTTNSDHSEVSNIDVNLLKIYFSRWDIREKEEMKQFFEFVYHENEIGNISRQELVSMVPVLLLVSSFIYQGSFINDFTRFMNNL